MAYERVQKSFGQSSSKKKHTPLVPPIVDHPTQADSQLSPLVKPSRIPSSEERDAIKRKIFDSIRRTGENQAMREGLFSPTVREQKTPDSASAIGMPIQPKLTIGAPGDKYEQEADRVAAQVVNQINTPVAQQSHENQEREVLSVEEEELQMKPMVQLQSGAGGMTTTPNLENSIQQARSGGQPLANNILQPMEQAFGADFSGVKVHTDAQADQLNQSIQAKTFTTGQDVFFRQGEYNPGSRGGQELLAHELTHVVQQNGGAAMRSPLKPLEHTSPPDRETLAASETIQCYWERNKFGQWEDNAQGNPGYFWDGQTWQVMNTAQATQTNLAIALQSTAEADPGGHLGTAADINQIASDYATKPTHTVIDQQYLWWAMYQLASDVLTTYQNILNFNLNQVNNGEKGPMNFRGTPAVTANITNINAQGWVVRTGTVSPPTMLRSITIEQLTVTAYMLPDGSFQFHVPLLHWTPRA